MLEEFTASTFAPRVGERFSLLVDDAQKLELELVSVTSGLAVRSEALSRRGPFSLVFRGPLEPILDQRIYRFANDELGTFDLFIVPVGYGNVGFQYEAVFG